MSNFYRNKEKITFWLNIYNITNYELIPDDEYGYVVNVKGGVNLSSNSLKSIPVKFNEINGDFNCMNNNLTSLEFCPSIVSGYFYCKDNPQLGSIQNIVNFKEILKIQSIIKLNMKLDIDLDDSLKINKRLKI